MLIKGSFKYKVERKKTSSILRFSRKYSVNRIIVDITVDSSIIYTHASFEKKVSIGKKRLFNNQC